MPTLTSGPEILVNTTTTGNQWLFPAIARLQDGNYVVAWSDNSGLGGDASGGAIKAQLLDPNGGKIGPEFLVNQNTPGDQYDPKIAVLGNGTFVVTWTDNTGDADSWAVKARIYDQTGTPLGNEFLVNTKSSTGQWDADILALANGGFLVTWADQTGDSSLYGTRGQLFDGGGTKVGGEFQVNTTEFLYQNGSAMAALPGGGFVVTWNDFSFSGGDFDRYSIRAQIYDADGNRVGGEFLVNTTTLHDQGRPTVATLADGNFVITWMDNSFNGSDPSGWSIRARLFSPAGVAISGEFEVNQQTAGHQQTQEIIALASGGFVIAWEDEFGDGSGYAAKARIFDPDGTPDGDEFLLNATPAGNQMWPELVETPTGFAAVWSDSSGALGDPSGFGVVMRLFSFGPNVITGTEGDDTLNGTADNDLINALGGADFVNGFGGDDTINGGEGDDALFGDGGNSYNGPSGDDMLYGGGGDDFLRGGAGVDYYDGGEGFDRISFHMRAATQGVVASLLTMTIANDGFGNAETMLSIEGLGDGTAFADHLTGDDNANFLLGSFGDTLIGNGGADTFQLTGAPALTDGGSGTDTITGFLGDIFGTLVPDGPDPDSLADVVFPTTGVHVDLSLGMIVEDGFGNAGSLISIENVTGSGLTDTLVGDNGANVLSGMAGDDLLDGQDGDDMLDGGDGEDTASYAIAGGGVQVSLVTGSAGGAAGNDLLISIENISGSEFDDALIGNSGDNFLEGRGGNDFLQGGQGQDDLDGGEGNDTLSGNAGNDSLAGGAGDDLLNGNPGNDTLDGGDDNDRVVGGPGNDTLLGGSGHEFLRGDNSDGLTPGDDYIDGGAGFDRATFYNTNNGVTVSLLLQGGPQNTGQGWDTLLNVEAISGSVFSDTLIGDDNDNWFTFGGAGVDSHTVTNDTISGNGGNDLIIAGQGNHVLDGGGGTDTVGFAWIRTEVFGGVTVSLALQGAAQDTGQGSMTLSDFENLSGSGYDDVLTGDAGANLLAGNAGSDMLYGGAGNDVLLGDGEVNLDRSIIHGAGPITVYQALDYEGVDFYDADGKVVFLFEGQDLYDANGNQLPRVDLVDEFGNPYSQFTLNSVNYDFYVFTGSSAISDGFAGQDILDGGAGDDALVAGAGNDSLDGGAGNDSLDGGSGTDTVFYWNSAGPVDIDLGAGVAYEYDTNLVTVLSTDTLTNIESAIGSAFDDALVGSAGYNYLDGFDGDDIVQGRGGDDQVNGGAGNDTLSGDFGNTVLTGGGNDYVDGGDGNDAVRGRDGNDTVLGGSGNDFVEGGTGDDFIDGGSGFDRAAFFSMATGGVTVDLNLQGVAQNTGQGWDTLVNIENLSGTAFADVLIGDGGDNWFLAGFGGGSDTVTGNGGDDLVEVGAGNHNLSGGAGLDTLSLFGNSTEISAAGVTVSLAAQGAAQNTEQGMMTASGFENLSGSLYDDSLTGDAGANILLGDGGSDTLNGGDGNDTLYGDGRMWVDLQGGGGSGPITLFSDSMVIQSPGVAGDDILIGGKGNDILHGGRGNDILTGGAGADRYVIEVSSGADRIKGFAHADRIVFDASSGVDSFSDLVFTAVGKDTLITWDTGDSILVEGFKPKELTAADFEFGPSIQMPLPGDTGSGGGAEHGLNGSHDLWLF